MTRWLEPAVARVPRPLIEEVGGHRLVAETLVRRGIRTREAARAFLDPSEYPPAPPGALPGLEAAANRLRRAIAGRESIAVWGDFDADGQTATALLLEILRNLGARVGYYIPTRQEGHGLHRASLERLLRGHAGRGYDEDRTSHSGAGPVSLLITCDTGISAHDAVADALAQGVDVIITDHHVPGASLPHALAVVNPHLLAAGHPLASLTGVGVAYQVARALDPAQAERSLDLVGLGTVADVGTLTADNRYLVQLGLAALQRTERPGLQALYEAAELRPGGLTEEHIGFVLGPRLNALGRLGDASDGVELLTTATQTRARILASQVEGLNARRQWITRRVTEGAVAQIERNPSLLRDYGALVLSARDWEGGVLGIVASRLAERYRKPTALIAVRPGHKATGSARSVPGVNLIQALADCAELPDRPPLFERYGGHRAAAGFSLDAERISELRAALSRAVATQAAAIEEPMLAIDTYLELPDLTLDLVLDISRLAPFGQGNPPLIFAIRDLRRISEAPIGRTQEHRRITVQDAEERSQTIFWWHGSDGSVPEGLFDLAVTARASDYQGQMELQVEWIDAQEREPDAIEVAAMPAIEIRDHRTAGNARQVLQELLRTGDWQVWAEGAKLPGVGVRTRLELAEGPHLILWTLPPSPSEFQASLARVRPTEVALFAHEPGLHLPAEFLRRLAGMVVFALRVEEGRIDLERAAAKLGHRRATVEAGLEVLAAQGSIEIMDHQGDTWHLLRSGDPPVPEALQIATARLKELLDETAAYREYARTAPAQSLFRL